MMVRSIGLVALLIASACGSTTSGAPNAGDREEPQPVSEEPPRPVDDPPPIDRSYDAEADEATLYSRITNPPKRKKRKRTGVASDHDDFEPDEEALEVKAEEEKPVSIDALSAGAHLLRHTVEGMDVIEAVFVTDSVIVTAAAVIEGGDEAALEATLGALAAPLAECYARFHDAHGAMSLFAMIGTRTLDLGGVGFYLIEADQIGRDNPLFAELAKEVDECPVAESRSDLPRLLVSQLRAR